MEKINLDNNYYFISIKDEKMIEKDLSELNKCNKKIDEKVKEKYIKNKNSTTNLIKKIPEIVMKNAISVEDFTLKKVKQNGVFFIKVNFNVIQEKDYKKILRNLLSVKKSCIRRKIKIGKNIDNFENIEEIEINDKDFLFDNSKNNYNLDNKNENKNIKNQKKENLDTLKNKINDCFSGPETYKSLNGFNIKNNSQNKKCIGIILNYDEKNEQHKNFIYGINAILYNSKYEMYNYIYDQSCNYLDSFFYGKNLCDFKDNQCGEKRGTSSFVGCCHHFKHKSLGPFSKLVQCEYLTDEYKCGAKCIGCKLFTCDYLERKGIKFRIKDILLLDTFFNPIQKYFIKYKVFTPKEKIMKLLMLF